MNKVIEFKNCCFLYDKDNIVLNHVNCSIEENEFVAIIGPNGSGKSTLLKLLLNTLTLDSGEIKILNQNHQQFKDFKNIGYVPQNVVSIYQHFPANVFEVVQLTSKNKQKTQEALAFVGMEKHQKKLVSKLSGGQIQRVAIAKTIVNSPKILILDEPTTGIDKETTEKLYALLHQLTKQNTTVVMVTHDLVGCKDYISKALCLEDGTICTLTKEEIEHELAHKHIHKKVE